MTEQDDLDWVALALADEDEPREYLQVLHVIDGRVFASDGKRMHSAPTTLENGTYGYFKPLRFITKDSGKGELYKGKELTLEIIRRQEQCFNPASEMTVNDLDLSGGYFGRLTTKDGKAAFQREFVMQALFGMGSGNDTILHVHAEDDGVNLLYANDGTRSFVVMGLRTKGGVTYDR